GDHRDHRLPARTPGLRPAAARQPVHLLQARRAQHRDRVRARTALSRRRALRRRHRRDAACVDGEAEGRARVARGRRLVPAVLGRHGLHRGHARKPLLARFAPRLDRRWRRRDHARDHRQDDGHPAAFVSARVSFDTLLVANRGEIACRIVRSARAMGLRTVAVFSDADRDARHVTMADAAVAIGPALAKDSYLSIERLLAACARSGAQALHPGYGFLAESAAFARACREAGIVFVGPPAEAIEALGNKARAKQLAGRIGVPCLPGYGGADQSPAALAREAARIGAPLMIKAAAGGGGRGMRRVDDLADFDAACVAARSEAAAAFGADDLLLERLVHRARHVEVQVLADRFGRCIHLGERDCSTQRRHQKIVEEAPAPGVTPALRTAMGDAAIRLALAASYVGAGTIEFLL